MSWDRPSCAPGILQPLSLCVVTQPLAAAPPLCARKRMGETSCRAGPWVSTVLGESGSCLWGNKDTQSTEHGLHQQQNCLLPPEVTPVAVRESRMWQGCYLQARGPCCRNPPFPPPPKCSSPAPLHFTSSSESIPVVSAVHEVPERGQRGSMRAVLQDRQSRWLCAAALEKGSQWSRAGWH